MDARRGFCRAETELMVVPNWPLFGLLALMLSGSCMAAEPRPSRKPHLAIEAQLPKAPEDNDVTIGKEKGFAPGDRLSVDIFGLPELGRTVLVNPNGDIQLPMIGTIRAAGETIPSLTGIVRTQLMLHYVRDPQVTVSLVAMATPTIWVRGDVRTPGAIPVTPQTSLISALDVANVRDLKTADAPILLFRTVDGTRLIARFSLSQLRAGKGVAPPLYVGDVIHVGPDRLSRKDLKVLTPQAGKFYQLAAFPADMATPSGQ